MTTKFCKDKIQKLQQKIDEQYEMIKHLKNELLLCKEVDKDTIISKGKSTATIPPVFGERCTNFDEILKDRERAIKKRNASNE
jgi:hypothetical protein